MAIDIGWVCESHVYTHQPQYILNLYPLTVYVVKSKSAKPGFKQSFAVEVRVDGPITTLPRRYLSYMSDELAMLKALEIAQGYVRVLNGR